jgi:putative transposase
VTTLNEDLKSKISIPIDTRIVLRTTAGTKHLYEVQREDKAEVKLINIESNAIEYFKKSTLFDLHRESLAQFVYPNESWEGILEENKRSANEIIRALSDSQQHALHVRQALMQRMDKGANQAGRVPRALVEQISKEAREKHPGVPGLSRSSLYSQHRDWVRSGCHIAALLPRNDRKGNRYSRFDKEVLEIFDDFLKKHYLQRHAPLASDVYDAFAFKIEALNKERSKALKIPSVDTFRRWIRKLNRFEVTLKRHGESVARKLHGFSASLAEVKRPLEIVEVDHTPIDLQLISEITGIPCGRAWLTLLTDVSTRMIVGFDLSFDPPSYVSVARALGHAMGVKPKYEGTKNEWPCFGRIQRLRVDNGPEFHSIDFENSCSAIGIIIEYTPRRKPWRKPHVERLFREINNIFHSMPSSTFSNYIKKGDFNPNRNAYATIEAVRKALLRWIVDIYHQRPHRGIGDIPIRKWTAGVAEWPVALPNRTIDIAIALGQRDERILHEYGIEFRGEIFQSHEIATIRSHPDYRARQKVEIRYLDSDCTRIHVKHPDGNYVELVNVKAEALQGMSFDQMRLLRLHAQEELNREADLEGIKAAKEDIRQTLGFYGKRKRRLSREETRMTDGLVKNAKEGAPPTSMRARRASTAKPGNSLAHRSNADGWGSHFKDTNGEGF